MKYWNALAVLLEKRQAIHAQFRSALTYPSAILVISGVWLVLRHHGVGCSCI
jgi:type II secretory pathway component PulF